MQPTQNHLIIGLLSIVPIQHKYRKILNRGELYAYRHYLNSGGTKYLKLYQLKQQLDKFKTARNTNLPIHDMDLKRWSLQIACTIPLSKDEFAASKSFIYNFKKNICHCLT